MKNTLILSVIFSFLITTLGCSSGGGGGGGDESPNGGKGKFSVEITPLSVNVVDDGTTLSKMTWFSAIGKGDPGVSKIYIDVKTDHDFVKVESLFQNENEIIANINISDEVWGGTYQGNIVFSICADTRCNRHLAESPYTIPYNVQIKKSHIRYEPISAPKNELIEHSDSHLVISTQSGVQAGPIRYRVELDDDLGSLVFPPEMLAEFGITDISPEGFTLNPPALSDGNHLYQYKLGLSEHLDFELPLNIYYFVGYPGGVKDKVIFMQDTVVIDVLYGQKQNTGSNKPTNTIDYIATGINRNVLDGMQFTYLFDGGITNWMFLYENWREGKVEFNMTTENLEVGTYTARVNVKKPSHNVSGAFEVVLNVTDGILLQNLMPLEASYRSTYYTQQIGVRNTRARAGTWKAETNAPWITLINSTEEFSSPGEGRYITFDIDPLEIAKLPNNQTSEGTIQVTADDDSFPPAETTIKISKLFPEITSMSLTQIPAAEAFTFEVTGNNFDLVHRMPVGLLAAGSEYLEEERFVVEVESLTSTKMTLTHSGIIIPGTYEVVFENDVNGHYGYSIPLTPRPTITVVEK